MAISQLYEHTIGDRLLTIEANKLAQQANGSVVVQYGDTIVLVTVCVADEPRVGVDFLPLTVDYEERLYAAGKIPGGFIRREGRPSEQATLTSRLTDRSLRPLLPKSLRNEVQVVITVLSVDQESTPDILAVIGASTALTLSKIPFNGPVSAVSVGYINNGLILNPTLLQENDSLINLIVVSTRHAVVMVEAKCQEVSESLVLEAITFGHKANQEIITLQEDLQKAQGKPKMEIKAAEINSELRTAVSSILVGRLAQAFEQPNRTERDRAIASLRQEVAGKLCDTFSEGAISLAFEAQLKSTVRGNILEKRQHVDGRRVTEVRPISSEVGILPRTHGSGLFTRGQTQVLTITTLGSVGQGQPLDGLGLDEPKRFMHHYNFPSFSTGEVKRMGGPGRREIGHGALAEKAIAPVLPAEKDFPYTIRLVSEVLSSNGSTSMASVCSSSLSLMDAGIPIKTPVAGIAMGLVTGEAGEYVILTDIEGIEDAYGDMDFKVAGTSQGITAIQLDIKLQGLSEEIIAGAISQARQAHLEILGKMQQTIDTSRSELSRFAPRIYKMSIKPGKIGSVIGPGGKTIRSIVDETKATIDIENDGTIIIGSSNQEAAQRAIKIIEGLTQEVEVGAIYTGKVTRLMSFGAFVEVIPGKEGLVHISELADYRVAKVEDVVNIGDEVMVKVTEIDNMGRLNLSRRAVLEASSPDNPANKDERPRPGFRHPDKSGDRRNYQ